MRWAAFSLVIPSAAGVWSGRICSSRMRHTPATPRPFTIFGENGAGRSRAITSGSTEKFARIRLRMIPVIVGMCMPRAWELERCRARGNRRFGALTRLASPVANVQ